LLVPESSNPVFGITSHPLDSRRTCGGSSGGEGALVSLRGSPLGVGTDIGGSCRIPAAWCGVVGYKPTVGRISRIGVNSPLQQYGVIGAIGPLSRDVESSIIFLEAITREGQQPLQSTLDPTLPPPSLWRPPRDYRIRRVGVYCNDGWITPSTACSRAVTQTSQLLQENGIEVIEFIPPNIKEGVQLLFGLLSADGGEKLRSSLYGEEVEDNLKTILSIGLIPEFLRPLLSGLMTITGNNRTQTVFEYIKKKKCS